VTFNAGDIEAHLTVDRTQFQDSLRDARVEGDDFSHRVFAATLDADNRAALDAILRARAQGDRFAAKRYSARLDFDVSHLDEAERRFSSSTRKMDQKSKETRGNMSLLAASILALGPAALPLASVGVGALSAFSVAGLGAVSAIKGISTEMSANTTLGRAYQGIFRGITADWTAMAHSGAATAFGATDKAVASIQRRMPVIRHDTQLYTALLADAGRHVVNGLLNAYIALRPLSRDLADEGARLAASFDRFTGSATFTRWVAYARGALPQVEHTVEDLAQALAHLFAAGAGQGLSALSLIDDLARAINAVPLPVLQAIIPLLGELFLAIKALQLADKVGLSLRGFSGGLGTILTVGLPVVALLYGLNQRMAESAKIAADNAQQQNAFTDAIRQDHGTLGSHTVAVVAASDAYKRWQNVLSQLNLDAGDLTRYLGGNTKGFSDAQLQALKLASANALAASGNDALSKSLKEARDNWAAEAAAQRIATQAAVEANPGIVALARSLGMTVDEYVKSAAATKDAADAERAQTQQMQAASDGAGLLSQALDRLANKTLSVAETRTQFQQGLNQLTQTLKQNGLELDGNSDKALANQSAIQGLIRNAEQHAQAVSDQTRSGQRGREELIRDRAAIIDYYTKAAGGSATARRKVTDYINEIFRIPKTVPPTHVDVNTAEGQKHLRQLQTMIAGTRGKTISIGADTSGAARAVQEFRQQQAGETIIIPVVTTVSPTGQTTVHRGAGVKTGATGMLLRSYSTGAVERHEPDIFSPAPRGTVRVFAEPETEGEAYIPLANDHRRPRAQAILAETARILGGVAHFAEGAITKLPNGDFEYNGLLYASLRAAQNAETRANRAQQQAAQRAATQRNQDRATIRVDVSQNLQTVLSTYGVAGPSQDTPIAHLLSSLIGARHLHLGSSALVRQVQHESLQLAREAEKRKTIANAVTAANDRLTGLRSDYHGEVATVRGAVLGGFDISSAGNGSAVGFMADQTQQLAAARKFRTNIEALRRAGLNPALIAELSEKGYATAGRNASLLATFSKAQIGTVNANYHQMGLAADATGKSTAEAMYRAGLSAAAGLVRGLQSQEKAIDRQMAKISATMVSAIRRALGIHSPSRVFYQLGGDTIQGWVDGLRAREGEPAAVVSRAAGSIMGAASTAMAAGQASPAGGTSVWGQVVSEVRQLRSDLAEHPERTARAVGLELRSTATYADQLTRQRNRQGVTV
jgi:hypothetical protein